MSCQILINALTGIRGQFINVQNVRYMRNKHYNPKYRKERGQKFIKVDLSRFENLHKDPSEDEIRKRMQEKGLLPQRPWMEKAIYIGSTGSIFESYVPPEGDGKFSVVSKQGAQQNVDWLVKKTKSFKAVKKIKAYDDEFDTKEFANQAQEVYIKAHELLTSREYADLSNYVTEKAYTEMLYNMRTDRIIWKFVKSIDPTRVVHARVTSMGNDSNAFGQLTVRFHSQQILAIYDRFGRLKNGSEILTKDVLEYVVFEKHLSNTYGKWRLHAKILPSWLPPETPAKRTYQFEPPNSELEPIEASSEVTSNESTAATSAESSVTTKASTTAIPA